MPYKYFLRLLTIFSKGMLLTNFSVAFHKETSHLFCSAKQMIGFCMKRNNRLELVKSVKVGSKYQFLQNMIRGSKR